MIPPKRQSASGQSVKSPDHNIARQLLPALLGLWIALALLKFGQPVILDYQVAPPTGLLELIYQPWPVSWGYGVFAFVALAAMVTYSRRSNQARAANSTVFPRPRADLARFLPPVTCATWLIWQVLASLQTVGPSLTRATLPHYLVCGYSFFVGYVGLANVNRGRLRPLWLGIAGGWLIVVAIGWRQHFGGLAETREFFFSLPNWQEQSPELIAKVQSSRIYSTLVYPNALAGVMLLYSPVLILGSWYLYREQSLGIRASVAGAFAVGAAGCLAWSGSKAGWLLAVALGLLGWVVIGRGGQLARGVRPTTASSRQDRTFRMLRAWLALGAVVALALGGFWYRYHDYFAKGAKSVSARIEYWNVAWSNACARPLLGTGPGTFMLVYRQAKRPDAEMTRLAHNDYLQQATDSGFVGALLFVVLVGSVIRAGFRNLSLGKPGPVWAGIWLGVVGMSAHSLVEFGLFIPALAWPWFVAMGALAHPEGGGSQLSA